MKGRSCPNRFILQRFLLKKHLRHTFSVYPILVLALGAMFTESYQALHISPNTAFCGRIRSGSMRPKSSPLTFPVSPPGFLMLLVTIMSCFHLISECLHVEEPSKPLAPEPSMRIEHCQTVYQFTESKSKPEK